MNSLPRRTRWATLAFVGVAVVLLMWQLYVLQRNQRCFLDQDKPHVSSRDIAIVASRYWQAPVKYTFSLWHQLRVLDGATLVMPKSLDGHQFGFERVSRLHVEYGPRFEIPAATRDVLVKRAAFVAQLDGTPLAVVVNPKARRYVIAAVPSGGALIILPEALYEAETASTVPGAGGRT